MDFLSQVINGLHVGSIYALVALGYNMVYGIVKLINFAHGDIIMVGAYAAFVTLMMAGLPLWVAVLISIAVCAIAGMTIERVAYRRLRNSGAPRISLLITAIGVSMFLQNLFQLIFSSSGKSFPNAFQNISPLIVGGKQIGFITLLTIGVTVLLMIGLQLLVNKTSIGEAMRAVSEDPGAAKLMGINTNFTIAFTFGLGSGLAAIGAVLYSTAYPLIDPYMGSMLGLKAFVAAVLGGIGSIPGAMLGGFVMGVAESLTKGYISTQLADAVVFGILIIVLLVKPSGLLGKPMNEKV
jgi:branched-chain amino acid transport system permease protein